MKIKKTVILYCLLFCVHTQLTAQNQVTQQQAKQAALHTVQYMGYNTARKNQQISNSVEKVYTLTNQQKDTLMYQVVFSDGQAVLLSGSKLFEPVLARFDKLGNTSLFDKSTDIPPALRMLLDAYKESIDSSFVNKTVNYQSTENWENVLTPNNVSEKNTMTAVTPPPADFEMGTKFFE